MVYPQKWAQLVRKMEELERGAGNLVGGYVDSERMT